MMSKSSSAPNESTDQDALEVKSNPGPISLWLSQQGFENDPIQPDHLGVELIAIQPLFLLKVASALKDYGFDYLQCQGGYDEGPGQNLVTFYHLIAMRELTKSESLATPKKKKTREVRLKVFLPRESDLTVPSLYPLFKGADWQERETFDMFGISFKDHPHPKRLLMPEDWKGWPLRKDYIQPDFYEMQDAY